jgi:hypothetical protein
MHHSPLWILAASWWTLGVLWGSDSTSCFFQNQLLTKGMVILREKIHFYEGEHGGLHGQGRVWGQACAGQLQPWPSLMAGVLGSGMATVPARSLGHWVGGVTFQSAELRSVPKRGYQESHEQLEQGLLPHLTA